MHVLIFIFNQQQQQPPKKLHFLSFFFILTFDIFPFSFCIPEKEAAEEEKFCKLRD